METSPWWTGLRAKVPDHAPWLTLVACLPGIALAVLYAGLAARTWYLPPGQAFGVIGVVACFTVGLLSLLAAASWLATWRPWTTRLAAAALVLFSGLFWAAGGIIWMFLTFE